MEIWNEMIMLGHILCINSNTGGLAWVFCLLWLYLDTWPRIDFSKLFFIFSAMHRKWIMEQLSLPKQLQTRNLHFLLAANSRTCNRKTFRIPRLELCLTVDVSTWSDSTIGFAWIRSTPCRSSSFVANRISKVQQMLIDNKWKHVPTHQNPADQKTRPVAAVATTKFAVLVVKTLFAAEKLKLYFSKTNSSRSK